MTGGEGKGRKNIQLVHFASSGGHRARSRRQATKQSCHRHHLLPLLCLVGKRIKGKKNNKQKIYKFTSHEERQCCMGRWKRACWTERVPLVLANGASDSRWMGGGNILNTRLHIPVWFQHALLMLPSCGVNVVCEPPDARSHTLTPSLPTLAKLRIPGIPDEPYCRSLAQ